MGTTLVLCFCTLVQFCFINVFTTNLYPLEDLSGLEAALQGPDRRVHGVHHNWVHGNATISLIENFTSSEFGLNSDDIEVIKIHTAFYIVWLIAEFILSVYIKRTWNLLHNFSGFRLHGINALWVIGWFGIIFHALEMMVIILQPGVKNDWYVERWNRRDFGNMAQWWIITIDYYSGAFLWGWIPVMLHRLALPSDIGVGISFQLTKFEEEEDADGANGGQSKSDGWADPSNWFYRSILAVCCIFLLGGFFSNEMRDDGEMLLLSGSLQTRPFAYFAAPAYLFAVVLALTSFVLVSLQRGLKCASPCWCFWIVGSITIIFMYLYILRILDRADFTRLFFFVFVTGAMVLAVLWHVPIEDGRIIMAILYAVAGIGCILIARFTSQLVFHYLAIAVFCCYRWIVPRGIIHVKIRALGETRPSYKELDEQAPQGQ